MKGVDYNEEISKHGIDFTDAVQHDPDFLCRRKISDIRDDSGNRYKLESDGGRRPHSRPVQANSRKTSYSRWEYADNVVKIVISEGITDIGDNSFCGFVNLFEAAASGHPSYNMQRGFRVLERC